MRLKSIVKKVQRSYLKQLYPGLIQIDIPLNQRKLLIPENLSWAYETGDYYEKNVIHQFDKIIKMYHKPVLMDSGAKYGYYTLRYADLCQKIFSFEPVAAKFQVLKRNLSRNNLHNVISFKSGLSDVNNQANDFIESDFLEDQSLEEMQLFKKKDAQAIELNTLDRMVENGFVMMPDIIKIDADGAELNVLIGGRQTITHKRPVMLLKYADNEANASYKKEQLLTILYLTDYKIYGIPDMENDLTLIREADLHKYNVGNLIFIPLEVNHLFNANY